MMKLRAVGADDVKKGPGNLLNSVTPFYKSARSKQICQQAGTHADYLLFKLVDGMQLIWDVNSFMDRAQELMKEAIDHQSMQITMKLQSLTGVAQSKKMWQQEDNSVNR